VGANCKQVRVKGPPLLLLDPSSPAEEAVIDTNVLLDWLVFADPGVVELFKAVRHGTVQWVASEAMLDELRHVLGRPPFQDRRPPDLEGALARSVQLVAAPPQAPHGLVCSDPDDQKFIDLALHRRARWLISRDRAVLKLARRARLHGVQVCPPTGWTPTHCSAVITSP
jgi:putative PIN family toxin of toxin-antitoxin system